MSLAPPIQAIKIYGERLSGTNYLQKVIKENFSVTVHPGFHTQPGGWKHGPPKPHLLDTKETLFVVIFRDAKSWIASFRAEPWHVNPQKTLDEFVTKPLQIGGIGPKESRLVDQTLEYGHPILEMRRRKIALHRDLSHQPLNVVFVHLSVLKKHGIVPLVSLIAEQFHVRRNPSHAAKWFDLTTHSKDSRIKSRERKLVEICSPVLDKAVEKAGENEEEKWVKRLEEIIMWRRSTDTLGALAEKTVSGE